MPKLLLLLALLLLLNTQAHAQSRPVYTGGNNIFITIEGKDNSYEYRSEEMLVRYNENTNRIECVLPIDNFVPANNATPTSMLHDLFYTAKFPELQIEIDAPIEKINAGNLYAQAQDKLIRIFVHGKLKEMNNQVFFTPDERSLMFSTNFDLTFDNMNIAVPAKYIPMLTGRILVTISNARWIDARLR